MIDYEQALHVCRTDPETAARMLCDLARELEVLRAEVAAMRTENATLRNDCQALREEIQALKEKVARDSHNSSKPPSSDGLAKPKPKSLRPPSERRTGGQPGHSGRTLRMVDKPDDTVRRAVEQCAGCGRSLTHQAPDRIERRQVFDLPEPKLAITEHQGEVKTCACGTFSQGTLANLATACSRRLEPVEAAIRNLATQSEVVGFDETGVRATGSLHWLHTVSTRWLTWYFAHKRRGREAMDAAAVLPEFRGRAVHDFWDSYLTYDCDHAFCNAHLLRELTFLWEEQEQRWAKGQGTLTEADLDRFLKRYRRIVNVGYAQNPAVQPPPGPKRRAVASRAKPAICSTDSGTIPTASSPSCATSRSPSTTISRSAICG